MMERKYSQIRFHLNKQTKAESMESVSGETLNSLQGLNNIIVFIMIIITKKRASKVFRNKTNRTIS